MNDQLSAYVVSITWKFLEGKSLIANSVAEISNGKYNVMYRKFVENTDFYQFFFKPATLKQSL